jgi:hypothetical protein
MSHGGSEMDDVREHILAGLMEGKSLASICRESGMPTCRTVQRWQVDDPEFDVAVTHAREEGYQLLAEQARIRALTADDPAKGRLAFDADRWYLGKLSNAFSDNKAQKHEVTHDLTDEAKRWLGQIS